MFKKYVLAMAVKDMTYTWMPLPFPYSIADMFLFYLWLYLDFSSYTDITVGAGMLVGLTTPENFNRPYVARNLIDFWDRWHMSLSRFIYRNVFVPVQLALLRRTGPERALWCGTVAFTVSFLLCGLWHELNLPWLAWGAMHAGGLVVVNAYRAFLQRRLGREGMSRYRANRPIRLLMTVVTQFYVAASMAVANWP
jgi:D-alanyl-lipoteichoic acid acyltransferase DltB (MBOAT superfamily)